jgi:hypothetical protein
VTLPDAAPGRYAGVVISWLTMKSGTERIRNRESELRSDAPCRSLVSYFREGVSASAGLMIKLGSASASRISASLVVSSMRVLPLWSIRTALNASWHKVKRFFVRSASKTISERIADTFRGTRLSYGSLRCPQEKQRKASGRVYDQNSGYIVLQART